MKYCICCVMSGFMSYSRYNTHREALAAARERSLYTGTPWFVTAVKVDKQSTFTFFTTMLIRAYVDSNKQRFNLLLHRDRSIIQVSTNKEATP